MLHRERALGLDDVRLVDGYARAVTVDVPGVVEIADEIVDGIMKATVDTDDLLELHIGVRHQKCLVLFGLRYTRFKLYLQHNQQYILRIRTCSLWTTS